MLLPLASRRQAQQQALQLPGFQGGGFGRPLLWRDVLPKGQQLVHVLILAGHSGRQSGDE